MSDVCLAGENLQLGGNPGAGYLVTEDQYFPCYFSEADGTPKGICAIRIVRVDGFLSGGIIVYAITTSLAIGDLIDLSPIRFLSQY